MADDTIQDSWANDRRSRTRRDRASEPFPANYRSTCHGCGFDIEPGEEIVMFAGKAVHDDDDCLEGA